jgi:hypothetical protein
MAGFTDDDRDFPALIPWTVEPLESSAGGLARRRLAAPVRFAIRAQDVTQMEHRQILEGFDFSSHRGTNIMIVVVSKKARFDLVDGIRLGGP